MTTLSKEDVVRMAVQAGFSSTDCRTFMADGPGLVAFSKLEELANLARADLVAENERLKEAAMFFSTYTDPDELEMDEIENAARESFRRANSGVRGTTITRANSYESHVIWATKARISRELTATRTALAAAEAREVKLRVALNSCGEAFDGQGNSETFCDYDKVLEALAQPRDDSALRETIAEVYEECVQACKQFQGPHRAMTFNNELERCMYAIRALAEKAKEEKC